MLLFFGILLYWLKELICDRLIVLSFELWTRTPGFRGHFGRPDPEASGDCPSGLLFWNDKTFVSVQILEDDKCLLEILGRYD